LVSNDYSSSNSIFYIVSAVIIGILLIVWFFARKGKEEYDKNTERYLKEYYKTIKEDEKKKKEPQKESLCPNCGAKIADEEEFCSSCGQKFK